MKYIINDLRIMIEEDYVSFETAKLLKGVGFDQNCATYYLDGQVWRHCHGEVIPKNKQIYAAPTQSITMKWLRETLGLYVTIRTMFIEKEAMYDSVIQYIKNNKHNTITDENSYNKIEEATEAAIKYCLENLESLIWK